MQQSGPGGSTDFSQQVEAWLLGLSRPGMGQPFGTGWNTLPDGGSVGGKDYAEVSEPLGSHLSASTSDEIWRGKFVDLFSLLFRERNPKLWVAGFPMAREHEQYRHPKGGRTQDSWLSGYTIYATVLMQTQPWKCVAIMKYLDIIHRDYSSYVGATWLQYDETFCSRIARNAAK